LIVEKGAKAKVYPVEVKSNVGYRTASLRKFKAKFGKKIGHQYVLHTRNIKVNEDCIYLPFYLALWL
jgi:hypothetical protein